jgi:hypothetical protein
VPPATSQTHTSAPTGTGSWLPLTPARSPGLVDARLQLHHAAQFAASTGISFLPPRPDDSHTNLEWIPSLGALLSVPVPAPSSFRVGVRLADITLLVTDGANGIRESLALAGHTIEEAAAWLRTTIAAPGVDASRYTLKRHYEIPPHAVAKGAPFRLPAEGELSELSHWYANGSLALGAVTAGAPGASEIRCWPHHFDIATLIDIAPGKTVGAGLEPGDAYYAEPYFYVNLHPAPSAAAASTVPLSGGGHWHTREWIGAVLPGSRLSPDPAAQRAQADQFLTSAVAGCRALLAAG